MTARDRNRLAWDVASQKHVEEAASLVADAAGGSLLPVERRVLADVLATGPRVIHLQSGNALDSVDLRRCGASSVVGVDFSAVAATAAAARCGADVRFAVGDALAVPLRAACADLVYTGKGALVWLSDLPTWAGEIARLLVPGGHVFVYDAHPAAELWTHDEDVAGIRSDRSYFGGTRANDSFPASAIRRFSDDETLEAIERQWTIADIVSAVVGAGLAVVHLGEHPEPFWRPGGAGERAAWSGTLPNSMSLLARRSSSEPHRAFEVVGE